MLKDIFFVNWRVVIMRKLANFAVKLKKAH